MAKRAKQVKKRVKPEQEPVQQVIVGDSNVERLVQAAWRGMVEEIRQKNASGADVISATINIARMGIRLALDTGKLSPEQAAHNRKAIRDTIQQFLLDTVDEGQVM